MLVKFKTTKKQEASVEAEPSATVGELLMLAEGALDTAIRAGIFQGKHLDEEQTLRECGIGEGMLLILVPSKGPRRKPPSPPPAASVLEYREGTARLLALGIAESEAMASRAMEMGGGDLDSAAELIMTGAVSSEPAPGPGVGGGAAQQAAAGPGGGGGDAAAGAAGTTPAAILLGQLHSLVGPETLAQMRAQVQADPQLLRPLLEQLGQAQPQLLSLMAQQPAAFTQLLAGAPPNKSPALPHHL